MKCSKCGAILADDVLFCRECGAKIEKKKRFCRECGSELADGVKFCSNCGAKVNFMEDIEINTASSQESTTEEIHVGDSERGVENREESQTSVETGNVSDEENISYVYSSIPQNKKTQNSSLNSKSIGDKIKSKAHDKWNNLDHFCKIATLGMGVAIILLLIAIFSHRGLPILVSILQIGGLVAATLLHKGIIKSQKSWLKYVVLVAAILFTVLNIMSYSAGKSKTVTTPTTDNPTQSSQNEESEPTEIPFVETNYTIEKGTQYAFMSDEWNVYIATAISDSIVKIEHWDKTMANTKKMSYSEDIGSYKINDSENGFSWIDDEHMAFTLIFQDKNNSRVKKPESHVFTINVSDSDVCKGTDYDEKIACYSYTNDDWHMYRAIPLSDHLIKIECWSRTSSLDKFLFGWDWCVIDTNNTDTDFEWTDEEHTAFTITTKDPDNSSYWKKDEFVVFELENEGYKYPDVITYLGRQAVGDDEAKVPDSASGYKYEDYKDVQDSLSSAGFTNIKTEILYDIVLGWTDEGEVESVSINGRTDYEKGEVFKRDAPIIITYHMKEEDDPSKPEESKNSEPTNNKTTEKSDSKETSLENLTVDNCPELASMLSNKAEIDESYSSFATKYKGRIIEFDGRIDYCAKHENYNTRFDYLVSSGDYNPDHQVGPSFKFEDVNYYDLNTDLDTVSVGLNVHIVAEVRSFDSNSGLFYLEPVSVTGR